MQEKDAKVFALTLMTAEHRAKMAVNRYLQPEKGSTRNDRRQARQALDSAQYRLASLADQLLIDAGFNRKGYKRKS